MQTRNGRSDERPARAPLITLTFAAAVLCAWSTLSIAEPTPPLIDMPEGVAPANIPTVAPSRTEVHGDTDADVRDDTGARKPPSSEEDRSQTGTEKASPEPGSNDGTAASPANASETPNIQSEAVDKPGDKSGDKSGQHPGKNPQAAAPRPQGFDDADNSKTGVPSRPVALAKPRLVVSSWAGAYGDAQERAIIEPLAKDLGIEIVRRVHVGEAPDLASVDVTELDQENLVAACGAGRLAKFRQPTARRVTADTSDFIANAASACGVPTFAWSSLLIANVATMKKLKGRRYREPADLADLLDAKRFPGKRALIRSPRRVLEMMLLADGVASGELYDVLATRQGQDRAFKLLDEISDDVLWVDGPREAMTALDTGNATIAMTYSGRAFRRLVASDLKAIWDGHIIDYASWAVPASSQNKERAARFILAATSAERLAAQARLWPYGPMRRSAIDLAGRHDLLDTDLGPYMPTSAERLDQGLIFSAVFWNLRGKQLDQRFEDWQEGIPLGIRVPRPAKAPPPPMPPLPRRS